MPSLKSVISLLKLSDWDADVFFKFRDILLQEVRYIAFCLLLCERERELIIPPFLTRSNDKFDYIHL